MGVGDPFEREDLGEDRPDRPCSQKPREGSNAFTAVLDEHAVEREVFVEDRIQVEIGRCDGRQLSM
jgi:hypothetical protein